MMVKYDGYAVKVGEKYLTFYDPEEGTKKYGPPAEAKIFADTYLAMRAMAGIDNKKAKVIHACMKLEE